VSVAHRAGQLVNGASGSRTCALLTGRVPCSEQHELLEHESLRIHEPIKRRRARQHRPVARAVRPSPPRHRQGALQLCQCSSAPAAEPCCSGYVCSICAHSTHHKRCTHAALPCATRPTHVNTCVRRHGAARLTRPAAAQVGTSVVTRNQDQRLAIGRLGALVESLETIVRSGRQVILVTSGATAVGRQKLRFQQVLNSSPLEMQMLGLSSLQARAAAAAGQSGLMALYDSLFQMMDMQCSQFLVTSRDFKNSDFRRNLVMTVDNLLAMNVVPVINENDSITSAARARPLPQTHTTCPHCDLCRQQHQHGNSTTVCNPAQQRGASLHL
jgi:Amino acid kinase family